ncbi:MAG: immunogenic protein [Candidatus Xenolissoclinum pacificiensis L6]|uniref:Immunogenic protein n=1 Tax=Candidatus Xenolissoclinum pacificiensis L6 TaxID=1401685 RepID=W2UZY5_9RICK|nr:MAG: immunogenic protein [Candidatus Xenolissoclinum pacificiensis L6]
MHPYSRYLRILFIFICLVSFGYHSTAKEYIRVGTASITGSYYPFGNFICKILNDYNASVDKDKRIICSVQTTPGTIYNKHAMLSKNMEFAIIQNDLIYTEYRNHPDSPLRVVFGLHKEALNLATRSNTDINVFDDVFGGKINTGVPGTGTRYALNNLLREKGWEKSDFSVYAQLRNAEQTQALCDSKIDLIADFVAIPSAVLKEALVTCGIRVVKLGDYFVSHVVDKYPYYEKFIIPVGTYDNSEPISTISVRAMFVTHKDEDEEMVYQVTKNALENLRILQSSHGVFKTIKVNDLLDINHLPYDIHPGACRYYKEKGYKVANCD